MTEQDLIGTHDQRTTLEPGILRRLGPRAPVIGFLIALFTAEALTTLFDPRLGMVLHGLLFISLLLIAALNARGTYQKFLFALTLAPLIRLLSLSMPLAGFPFVYWYAIVGAPLFLAVISLARLLRLGRVQLGLELRRPGWQLLVGSSGIAFGLLEYSILRPKPLIDQLDWRGLWLPALILLVFTGFLEELIFRGVMQYSALRKFGRFGLWYVAGVFAILHLGYRSLLDVVFVFAVALFFGWVVIKTGSILGVTLSHGLTNITLYLVIPFYFVASPTVRVSTTPQEIQPLMLPVPPALSQVANTPFQPLPTGTPTLQPAPDYTASLPSSNLETSIPSPVEDIVGLDPASSPSSTATSYIYPSPVPPSHTPTFTPTMEMATTVPKLPSITPTMAPTGTVPPSQTATATNPIPTRTPENTPTPVQLSPTPTSSPMLPTAASSQTPTLTPQPTDGSRITPPATGDP